MSLSVLTESPTSKNQEMFLSPIISNFPPLLRSQELWPCWAHVLMQQRWAEAELWPPPVWGPLG